MLNYNMDLLCIGSNDFINYYYSLKIRKELSYDVKCIRPEELNTPEIKGAKAIILTKYISKPQLDLINKDLRKNKYQYKVYSDNDFVKKERFSFLETPPLHIKEPINKKLLWIPIPFNILKIFKTVPCDIHSKNGLIYEKIFVRGSKPSILKKAPKKVYISHRDIEVFTKIYSEAIESNKKSFKIQSRQGICFDLGFYKAQILGLNKRDISDIENLIDDIVYELSLEKSEMMNLLYKILNSETYITAHSLSLVHILFSITKNKDISKEIKKTMMLAAIFHDFKMESLYDTNEFEEKKTNHFISHTENIIKLLEKFSFSNELFKDLVKFHHEKPDGSGIYKLNEHNIPKMCSIFNIAHQLSLNLLHMNPKESIKDLEIRFNKGLYKKSLENYFSEIVKKQFV